MDASGIGRAMGSTNRQRIGPSAKKSGAVSKLSSQSETECMTAEGRGGGWRTWENNGAEAETSQGHNCHSGRKGDGIKAGRRRKGSRGTGADPASFQQP